MTAQRCGKGRGSQTLGSKINKIKFSYRISANSSGSWADTPGAVIKFNGLPQKPIQFTLNQSELRFLPARLTVRMSNARQCD